MSSSPRLTFLPGWNLVPRWRTMMLPLETSCLPKIFTPRRLEMESRPRAVDPPAFLVAIARKPYTLRKLRYTGFEYITALSFGQDCMKERFFQWFQEKKDRIALFAIVLLVGALCFEAGLLQGQTKEQAPLVLSVPALPQENGDSEGSSQSTVISAVSNGEPVVATENKTSSCLYVGSKNSNKYHLSTCPVAKRIKPENRVCFSSQEEAKARGYLPSCLK